MEIELCQPCSTRYIEFSDACKRIGERLEMPLLVALLCATCLVGVVEAPPGGDPAEPASEGTGFYL